MRNRIFLTAAAIALTGLYARADVKLPAIISDNMCLQAGKTLPIWGTATAGEAVTVSLNGQKETTTAGADGKWMVKLPAMKPGGPLEMSVTGKNKIFVKNIVVGEVWVASGQSNMEFGFRQAHNAAVEGPKATHPMIRIFNLKKKIASSPQTDCEGHWEECSPETVTGTSAVGYFFVRDLHEELGEPMGLIHTSWGGTPAESWTSLEALSANPDLKPLADKFTDTQKHLSEAMTQYDADALPKWQAADKKWHEKESARQAEWSEKNKAALAAGQPALPPLSRANPAEPRRPAAPGQNPNLSSVLYNGMIAPIVPFGIEGAIWYQGESNAGRSEEYRTLFPAMISDWRNHWSEFNPDEKDFPFIWVQLANFMARQPDPVQAPNGWPGLREAQHRTLSLANTGEAVIIDIGQAEDIHPKDKMDVGHRLALAAEKVAYHKQLIFSGPTYRSMTLEGNKIRIDFANAGSGLKIAAAPATQMSVPQAAPTSAIHGFSIAGEDKKFYWANATIDGDTVVVSCDQVAKPVAVRYAWSNNPDCNLYNKENLPTSPFRTDDWSTVIAPRPTK